MKTNKILFFVILFIYSCSSAADSAEKDLGEEELLSTGIDLYSRGLYTTARDSFVKFQSSYPVSFYSNLAELKIADCDFFAGDYAKAITTYQNFLQAHPKTEAAEYALLQIAKSYQGQHNSTSTDQTPLKKAIENYDNLINTYPESVYVKQSVEAIAEIREILASHEIEVAEFYAKQNEFAAARHRLEIVLNQYPDTKAAFDQAPRLAQKYQLNVKRIPVKPVSKLEQIKNRQAVHNSASIKNYLKASIRQQQK